MEQEFEQWSFPLSLQRTKRMLCAFAGILLGVVLLAAWIIEKPDVYISAIVWLLICGIMGLRNLLYALLRVSITEQEVTLTLLGFVLRRYSADRIGTLCQAYWVRTYRGGRTEYDRLGICLFTPDGGADLRVEQIQKSWILRWDIPLLKRKPDWKETLCKQYLMKQARRGAFWPGRKQILWIECSDWRIRTLRRLYSKAAFIRVDKDDVYGHP